MEINLIENMRKIVLAAMSDMHGLLPDVNKECELICICGDIFPQDIERKIDEAQNWFYEVFLAWVEKLPCKFVIMILGNHCFYLEYEYKHHGKIILPNNIKNKCLCLVDESFSYQGIHFYGTPWVTNLPNWAYNTNDPQSKFKEIPSDCDVLLTHHAPDFEKLGCSYPNTDNEKNYGCIELANAILARPNIKYHFCGHIHTGIHGGVKLGNALSYNVSILDEQYKESFPITYVELAME